MPFPSALRRTKSAHRARTMTVVTAVAASSMLGLSLAAAAPASAVTGSACTPQVKLDTRVTATVNLRTRPGTSHTSLGLAFRHSRDNYSDECLCFLFFVLEAV
ncbi:hypothetical protein [Streptomyces sp. IBSBF 3136]|uniref:hypothetical protein n=1 Tax=Streptomyces sp. IBSBF 3136 TaxID=2903524 RepID=UPI002FDC571E